jgi:hypothetical protein
MNVYTKATLYSGKEDLVYNHGSYQSLDLQICESEDSRHVYTNRVNWIKCEARRLG